MRGGTHQTRGANFWELDFISFFFSCLKGWSYVSVYQRCAINHISGICTKKREVANKVGTCPVSRKGNCKKAFLGLLAIVLCDNKVASSVQENSV